MAGLDTLIFFVLALMALSRRGGPSSSAEPWLTPEDASDNAARAAARALEAAARAAQNAAEAAKASATPAPWPQAMPAGLPAFPSGWEYSKPVTPEVRTRAWQLLSELWKRGSGATRTELTAGNWITYRAEITAGGKRGVVAYRPKVGAKPAPRPAAPMVRSPGMPQGTKTSTPAPASRSPGMPPSTPAPAAARAERPLLLQGAGMGSLEHLAPYVESVQLKLRLTPVDGKYGAVTREAVRTFQKSRGFGAAGQDGKVGPNTWRELDKLQLPAGASARVWAIEVGPTQMAS